MSIDSAKISKLGFGLMRLPEKEQTIDMPQLCKMVDSYMEKGFNYFDTAYIYVGGKSESAVKEAITSRYKREDFYLATKLPQWMLKTKDDRDRVFNEQLARTGVDYFDFYLLHSIEDGSSYAGYQKLDCFNWIAQKKKEGKIKHIGFSFHGTPELLDTILADHPEFEFVQIQLNYADWDNPIIQSERLYEVVRKYNLPIIVMEPVKGGILSNVSPEIESLFKKAHPEATAASWALRYAASLEGILTVLSGMSNEEQMNDNLATFSNFAPLTNDEQQLINEAKKIMQSKPTIACTACRYCCDGCPQKIAIPDIFSAMNAFQLYGEDMRPHFYYRRLLERSGRAKDCIECGQCEPICPQHLSIPALLKEAAAKLDKE